VENIAEKKRQVLKYINSENIINLHQESVRIQSITGSEKDYAEFLLKKINEIGLDDSGTYDIRPKRPNIWGVLKGNGGGKNLLLVNHTDTVPVVGWEEKWKNTPQENPFSGEIIDEELWGRGSIDNKAGMTSSLIAMKAIKDAGIKLRGDIIFSAHVDEEGCSEDSCSWGIKGLAEAYNAEKIPKADFCIWSDCSDGMHIYFTQLSMVALEINIYGKSAYPGTPWLGVNAITKAQRVLEYLEKYSEETWIKKFNKMQGHPRNVAYSIKGGDSNLLSVPDNCSIRYIMWGIMGDEPEDMYKEVESILQKTAILEGLDFKITILYPGNTGYGYSSEGISLNEPMLEILSNNLEEITGMTNMIASAPYVGETSWIIKDMKIPAVYFGPGKLELCHTLDERINIEELLQHTKVLALSIIDYCF